MKRALLVLVALALASCTAAVSDIGAFGDDSDACDPRGVQHLGEDLTMHFRNTTAHINQDMRFAFEVGDDRSIEALGVISAFSDPDLDVFFPEIMPAEPTTLAFWADSNGVAGFTPITPIDAGTFFADTGPDGGDAGAMIASPPAPDHQWFRPVCPNGDMTFTHTTPFQDISHASSTGAVFVFQVPMELQTTALFDNFAMAVWAVRVQDDGSRQTRVYYQWHPFVAVGGATPPQRPIPPFFQVGGNVLAESRGAIDTGELYEVNFIIDVNHDGHFNAEDDYACQWSHQMAVGDPWSFDITTITDGGLDHACDANGFDPMNPGT